MSTTHAQNRTTPTPSPPHKGEGKKGPLVWRDMDQQALDRAYDQAVYAPNRDQVLRRIAIASEGARQALGAPQRVAYGPSEQERLDIYEAANSSHSSSAAGRAKDRGAPVNVFVHGGAWRGSSAAECALMAEPLVGAGAHAVLIDFVNVGQIGGDLIPLYRQVSRALAWVWRNAERFGGDPDRMFVSAHSSGAHLAACALTTGWREEGLPPDFCKGALLVGGMYDLAPVRLSSRSTYVAFTDEVEQSLSPIRHIDGLAVPLILAHGTVESPEFQRQTRDFLAAVTAAGKPAELIVGEGYNHFDLFETLANPYGILGRARLRQMAL
jgi:arylformamidase